MRKRLGIPDGLSVLKVHCIAKSQQATSAGRYRQTVTYNHVFEAMARRWSDHFRLALTESRAFQVRDMKKETAQACRRDLVRAGVRLDILWKIAVGRWSAQHGKNPLYHVQRLPYSGYQVFLVDDSATLSKFERLVLADRDYRRPIPTPRLLLADDPIPAREPRREIAAEVGYNVVQFRPRSEAVLKAQEGTRILLDVTVVREDFMRAERVAREVRRQAITRYGVDPELSTWRPRRSRSDQPIPSERDRAIQRVPPRHRNDVCEMLEKYDRARGLTVNLRAVINQLGTRGEALIKSRFTRLVNRRFHPLDFWPSAVTAKLHPWDEALDLPSIAASMDWDDIAHSDWSRLEVGARWRWFKFERITTTHDDIKVIGYRRMVGVDVSASQTQILSLLLGLGTLEQVASSSATPFKAYLATQAWQCRRALKPGYRGANDPRLIELCKATWMQILYGSTFHEVVWKQRLEPLTFGPGWRGTQAAQDFLSSLPWFHDVARFLKACRRLVEIACARDRYAGVTFTDPFDRALVRWNPIERADVEFSSEGHKLVLSLPGRRVGGRFHPAAPNDTGDYPVDRRELRNMVAPCLVHMLDAYLSGLVLERLAAHGVSAIGIHDAWLVPDGEIEVLAEALKWASVQWFKGLAPIYTRLLKYLRDDTEYGGFVREIMARWRARVRTRRWPQFAVVRSDDTQAVFLDPDL